MENLGQEIETPFLIIILNLNKPFCGLRSYIFQPDMSWVMKYIEKKLLSDDHKSTSESYDKIFDEHYKGYKVGQHEMYTVEPLTHYVLENELYTICDCILSVEEKKEINLIKSI